MTLRCSLSVAMARLLVRAAFVAALAAITARQHGHDIRALQAYLRPPEYPTYGALHRIIADTVSGFLARMKAISEIVRELSDYFHTVLPGTA